MSEPRICENLSNQRYVVYYFENGKKRTKSFSFQKSNRSKGKAFKEAKEFMNSRPSISENCRSKEKITYIRRNKNLKKQYGDQERTPTKLRVGVHKCDEKFAANYVLYYYGPNNSIFRKPIISRFNKYDEAKDGRIHFEMNVASSEIQLQIKNILYGIDEIFYKIPKEYYKLRNIDKSMYKYRNKSGKIGVRQNTKGGWDAFWNQIELVNSKLVRRTVVKHFKEKDDAIEMRRYAEDNIMFSPIQLERKEILRKKKNN